MTLWTVNSDHSIDLYIRGEQILQNPLLNKGTAFSKEERTLLSLHGLLPPQVKTLQEQVEHCFSEYQKCTSDLGKHIYLRSLQDRNEVLFYALLRAYLPQMLPIVYTPTVGEACRHFYEIYRKPRGLFISYPQADRMEEMLENCSLPEVKAIVVTDGGRILGLGDQGAGGMGIAIGKASLYTACGGLHPAFSLPIILDVGTDNEALIADPFYMGWKHPRLSGDAYYDFIDRFIRAVKRRFPHALLQWEDFSKQHAHKLLERYRDSLLTFNDDIQGTAAVTLAAIYAGVKIAKRNFCDERIVIVGAGSSGMGIAQLTQRALMREGLSEEEALERIFILNSQGLICDENPSPFSRFHKEKALPLHEVVKLAKPTVLIGTSASPGIFTKPIIRTMLAKCKQPIILPLSNPDSLSEAKPSDLIEWSAGEAIIATGTAFPPHHFKGRVYHIGQNNNHYIFPAIALGVIASQATHISEEMFLAAAKKLAEFSPALSERGAALFPSPEEVPRISKEIAVAVAQHAGVLEHEARVRIDHAFWEPGYPLLVAK